MKKIALTLLCASIVAAPAMAGGSYITGNLKANTERDQEYTLEAGHTFSKGTTFLVEIAGSLHDGVRSVTDTTFGIEQMAYTNGALWTAVGYHDLSLDGSAANDSGQRRPLVKIGYNFDNGVFISNRTRFHYDVTNSDWKEIRYDNALGYNMDNGIQLKLNVVYNQRGFADTDKFGQYGDESSYNTEWRITKNDFMGTGIAPYFELRDEDMGVNAATGKDEDRNLAFTFGASYGF